jgi:hypothetical protein
VRAKEFVDVCTAQQAKLPLNRHPSGARRPDGPRNGVLVCGRFTHDPGRVASHREKVLLACAQ